ncbi:hypothetical protein [Archangium sp.]|uniref:hypothetical protein n=1 Tax=Archangium sp. TaxID=1872627 RepID=UPI002D514C0D|nr:hypothetical protein [Archangium sp.]HYO56680.1 hypothetical protein [Archangium sp.]
MGEGAEVPHDVADALGAHLGFTRLFLAGCFFLTNALVAAPDGLLFYQMDGPRDVVPVAVAVMTRAAGAAR